MSAKKLFRLTPSVLQRPLISLLLMSGEALSQQFPIGTYWVRTDRERYDQYNQVVSTGININVGGHYGTSTLPSILAAAETYNLAMIIDHTTGPATGTDSILWYGGGNSQYDDIRAYRMEYESNGYTPPSALQVIEAGISYDFDHDVGSLVGDLPPATRDGFAWRAIPPTAGLLLYNYAGTDWQHPGYTYRANFRMKVDSNSGHVLVATVRIRQGTNPPLVEQSIYSDNFTANQVYQEFENQFTTPGPLGSSSESALEEIKSMLPEGSISSPAQIDLDYQVEYHGNRTLWVDYVAIENGWGDRLFDGSKDTDLRNEAQWAYNQDLGNPNIQGFYTDEPEITRLAPMRYVNDLLGPIAPARFGYRETMKSTVLFHHIFSQYLNTGQSLNQDYKLLIDYYPLEYGALRPGDVGYNNYVQGRWENQLIPALRNARLASSFNNKSYWYAIQAHSWDFPGSRLARDPHPNEMRCMVYLGLAYGAKGIFYFLYTSIPAGTPGYVGALGLVDNNFSHSYEPYLSKWNMVQQINGNLQLLATDLLSLNWQSAFTPSAGDPVPSGSLVQNVTGGNAGGNYVEVGNFTHSTSGEQYFMLVNRRCEIADVQTVTVSLTSSSGRRLIEDVLASRVAWDGNANRVAYRTLEAGNNTFTVTLNPGEGRIFRVTSGLSGTLTANRYWSGAPYVIDNLTVNSGVTLTVERATTIKFASSKKLTINGSIQAIGTSSQGIAFDRIASTGTWSGIWIENSTAASSFDYCTSRNASYGIRIRTSSGNVTINHATLTNNSLGLQTEFSSPYTVQNSTLQNNAYGIYVNAQAASGNIYILSNTITQNSTHGVYLYNGADPYLGFNTIDANCSNSTQAGVYCTTNSDPFMRSAAPGPDYGNNYVRNNVGAGVKAVSNSYPILGIDFQQGTLKDYYGYNEIYGNGGAEIHNGNTSGTIIAERNYWSSDHNVAAIPSDLYGSVDYTPVLGGPPTGIAGKFPSLNTVTSAIDFEAAFALEMQDQLQAAADLYLTLLQQDPNADNVGFGVSGLIRCYKGLDRRSYIVSLLDDFVTKYPNTALAATAQDHSLPYLVNVGRVDDALARAIILLRQNRNVADKEPDYLFRLASLYLFKSQGNVGVDLTNALAFYQELIQKYATSDFAFVASLELEQLGVARLAKPASETAIGFSEPQTFTLYPNHPNPFNPETRIKFYLRSEQHVVLRIYDVSGRLIQKLVDSVYQTGEHFVIWNGKDFNGRVVGSGVYFYELAVGTQNQRGKMTLIQ